MNVDYNILISELALAKLERHLNVEFNDKNLLKCAFINSTYKNENYATGLKDNQTFEFLGDAVLGLIISEYAFNHYNSKMLFIRETLPPYTEEGKFSNFRDDHIGYLLSEIADSLGLDDYLLKGNGESNNDEGKASRLEDLMEALIGAIFKDKGYYYVRDFVLNLFEPYFDSWFEELYEKELHVLDKDLEKFPNNYVWLTAKGKILYELKRIEDALKVLNKALLLIEQNYEDAFLVINKSSHEDALAFKGYCLYDLQEYEEGLSTVNKLIALNPKYELIWADKGNMLLKLNRIDEALEAYKKLLELEPNDADNLYDIAKIYSQKKNKKETLFYLEKAIDLDTDFVDAKQVKEFEWLWNDAEFRRITEEN